MEAFEPPKYLTSLIAAVNDGAKSAQAGAFLFLLVWLYLLATAFSASDEDLLLGKTVTISQIGASLPVSFSFAIAPLVFVFLHIYALVRYDMLASNVRQFPEELRTTVPLEADRERCRQLLINNEFVAVLTERAWVRIISLVLALAVRRHRRSVPGRGAVARANQCAPLSERSHCLGAASLAGARLRRAGLVLPSQHSRWLGMAGTTTGKDPALGWVAMGSHPDWGRELGLPGHVASGRGCEISRSDGA
jgi:hypothetical protein